MTFLMYFIPFLFLTLNPMAWKAKLKTVKKEDSWRDSNTYTKKLFIIVQILRFVFGIFYYWLCFYIMLLDKSLSAFFITTAIFISLFLILDGYLHSSKKFLFIGLTLFVIWLLLLIQIGAPVFTAGTLFKIVDAKTTDKSLSEIDIKHIPYVPLEFAKYKGDKVYSEIPNSAWYQVGGYSLQKIGNELVWVAPIEYNSFFKSKSAGSTPGYIKVSAENKDAGAVLVKDYHMVYIPSGYFSHNLDRLVRSQYPEIIILANSFEPDDEGKPFYVVSYGHYEVYRGASVVDGLIIVNSETGEMKKYNVTDQDIPKFVDQVIPSYLALKYSNYFGKYSGGFLNSIFSQNGVHVPTQWDDGQEVAGVFVNNQLQWFTDHTTTHNDATSMVGYVLMNAKTGEFIFHTSGNGFLNGKSALNVVNDSFKSQQWHGAQPVLYNIYGNETWVIPVMDASHLLRELALVDAKTGTIVHNSNETIAFEDYKSVIASLKEGKTTPTNNAVEKVANGTVKRFVLVPTKANTFVKIILDNSKIIFTADITNVPMSAFIHEGDVVTIKYLDTSETTVSIRSLENENLK